MTLIRVPGLCRLLLITSIILSIQLFGCTQSPTGTEPAALTEGGRAPDFSLVTPSGELYRLSQLHGKPVLIYFWTSWCKPCRDEMLLLQALYSRFQAQGFVLLAVNSEEEAVKVRNYGKELGLSYPLLADIDGRVSSMYNLVTIPTTYVIGKDQTVQKIIPGAMTREELEAVILDALGPTLIPPSETPALKPTATLTATVPPVWEGCVLTGVLNVRGGPGKEFEVVKGLAKGICVRFDARSADNEWLRMEEPDKTGARLWVAAKFIDLAGDLTSLPPEK